MARLVRDGGRGRGVAAVEETTPPLPLPPPPRLASAALSSSSPASIRALLSRTGGGADCQQSPRSLLSRILLRGGDHNGGNGGGSFGCRVRLPRRYGSSSSSVGESNREERKDDGAASEQSADDVGSTRVKVVQRAPELPMDTPRSSLGRKKPEEEVMSMNLGLGASLVLLLSKSAVELNKMVELRAQMEALVSEIRHETVGKEKQGGSAPAYAPAASSSSSQESTVIKDPIARAEDALSDNCSGARTADRRQLSAAVVAMDHNKMEAELQVELSRMQAQQRAMHAPMRGLELPPLQVKTTRSAHVSVATTSRSCVLDHAAQVNADEEEEDQHEEDYEEDEEEEEDEDDDDGGEVVDRDRSPPHGGVSARALERRLHELLQRRQQDRIVELEAALDGAQRRLQEREREVVWWRDAAKLVSHRRDESRRLRCTASEAVR
ncbi:protein POLAR LOCALIZATION DURING ASYMMETRIC DIVISION AND REDISTRIBUTION-like [Triticum dicoccoides]|uniref:protein POLAR LOCALIZATION DURING ASYMMETRIC DIVISION AND REDISTRIBUTION-like n=1 Tax=Triticum dicoccoides TaxID=85692 RepID=UPI001890EE83|nr:protein POLAR LOCALIZATION DURING ASYMMETRIC DIVISION AND REDISTRIBUTION-like [Triticum dicoccoides]